MNLLQQLEAARVPPPPSSDEMKREKDRARRKANILKAHEGQTRKAMAKYKLAMAGKGWMNTSRVEIALGCCATVANDFLRKLLTNNIIERRPAGGGEYVRNKGWEWRWKEVENGNPNNSSGSVIGADDRLV